MSNAADQMLNDAKSSVPGVKAIVLFDQGTFANVPYYLTAVDQIKLVLGGPCGTGAVHVEDLSGVGDIGTGASGLCSANRGEPAHL
jgi:hypothetical protein